MDKKLKFYSKILNYQEFNPDLIRNDLEIFIRVLVDVLQSIYDSKIKLKDGEVYIEALIIKMIYASKSLSNLSLGAQISSMIEKK